LSEKKTYIFKFDSDRLHDLFAFYGVTGENNNELLNNFFNSLYEKLILYKKSQTQPSEQKPLDDELTCKTRIFSGKSYYCISRPPKATRLLSLDVCKVCLALFRGLTDHTKRLGSQVEQAQKTPTPTPTVSNSDLIAQRLAKGELQNYCAIEKHPYPLLQLPCVKNSENPEEKTGCRFFTCEQSVRKALAVHQNLNRKPSG